MNQEQFGQFWEQLKAPLKAKWAGISEEDLREIKGNLDAFGTVLRNGTVSFGKMRWRYGPTVATVIGLGAIWAIRKRRQRCRPLIIRRSRNGGYFKRSEHEANRD